MEKKQTAVEWLVEQVNSSEYQKAFGQTYISIELVEQAKSMETVQIIEAYANGSNDRLKNRINEQYYNGTYGKQTDRS